jgi:hypothetical protein
MRKSTPLTSTQLLGPAVWICCRGTKPDLAIIAMNAEMEIVATCQSATLPTANDRPIEPTVTERKNPLRSNSKHHGFDGLTLVSNTVVSWPGNVMLNVLRFGIKLSGGGPMRG